MKYLNLDLDDTLGGENSSDYIVSSQKAIKKYVDDSTDLGVENLNNAIISSPINGQNLTYRDGKWVNEAAIGLNAGDGISIDDKTNTISTLAFVINDYTQEEA